MKATLKIDSTKELQWLYSPDLEYYGYGTCKRHLQIIFPYRPGMSKEETYPLILFIPGSAWHKQEMYNDIPQYAKLAERGFVVPPWMNVRPSAVLLGVDTIKENKELAQKASCGSYITEEITLPPVLLIHSEFDPVVSVENSRTLYHKLNSSGHKVIYYELENCNAHGGTVFYDSPVLEVIQQFCDKE